MRVLAFGVAALGITLVGSSGARAAEESVTLATSTCAAIQQEGKGPNPRMLAAAYAGRIAAKTKTAVLSPDLVQAITETWRRGCEGTDAAGRKLADVIAGIAIPPKTDKDRDFATLTCAQLAPIWREEARIIVPFLVALRDSAADAPITKASLDKVGEGLPKLCRDTNNAAKLVTEVAQDLK